LVVELFDDEPFEDEAFEVEPFEAELFEAEPFEDELFEDELFEVDDFAPFFLWWCFFFVVLDFVVLDFAAPLLSWVVCCWAFGVVVAFAWLVALEGVPWAANASDPDTSTTPAADMILLNMSFPPATIGMQLECRRFLQQFARRRHPKQTMCSRLSANENGLGAGPSQHYSGVMTPL
jgi:hypothetical protein